MKERLFDLMAKISGQAYNPAWEEKISSILFAGVGLIFILILFGYLFYKYFRQDTESRKLVFFTTVTLGTVIISKFILSRLWVGYIPDRLLFYALPSPKIANLLWLIFVVLFFLLFIKFRKKLESLNARNFLITLCIVFFLFSTSVAGIREGVKSIVDPLTRTNWEYTGNIAFIANTHDFLRDYVALIPKLALHSTTHPPGYSLLVYYFGLITNNSLLGIALLIILTAGLSVFPLYFLLKYFFDEKSVRQILQVYIFIPSIVLMSGTSLESFFLFLTTSIVCCFVYGWGKSSLLSAIGGILAGVALFSNFLFLLLAPVFLGLIYYLWLKNNKINILLNLLTSFLSFVLFFIILWHWSGYSIVENFMVSREANQEAVNSNFQSLSIYFIFLIMNILSFGFSLGVANLLIIFQNIRSYFVKNRPELWIGFGYVLFLFLIGIFQGELARLWMFVVPFFLFSIGKNLEKNSDKSFSLLLSLLFLQIIFVQILFYTYW